MRTMLGQLLHDLRKVDGRKKVPPGKLCKQLNLFLVLLAIREDSRLHYSLAWRSLRFIRYQGKLTS
jgi:hypothetical protein